MKTFIVVLLFLISYPVLAENNNWKRLQGDVKTTSGQSICCSEVAVFGTKKMNISFDNSFDIIVPKDTIILYFIFHDKNATIKELYFKVAPDLTNISVVLDENTITESKKNKKYGSKLKKSSASVKEAQISYSNWVIDQKLQSEYNARIQKILHQIEDLKNINKQVGILKFNEFVNGNLKSANVMKGKVGIYKTQVSG